jgi:acid phosphatase family membrane protein YuiD
MVIDLSGSKDVGVEKRSGARGMPVRVVVIHDAHVVRRIVGRDDEVVDYLALDYTRLMSRKGLNEWAASMRRVIRSSR